MFVLKNGRAPVLSGANCHAKLSHSRQLQKIFIEWCRHNFVNRWKDIYNVTPKNPKNYQLYATAATKKKDVATKCLCTRSAFRESLMASVGESQVVEKTQVVDHGSQGYW